MSSPPLNVNLQPSQKLAAPAATTQSSTANQSANTGLNPAVTAPALITASGVLLAFLLGFYTLIARERKSPYLINSAVWILLICLISALASALSMVIIDPYAKTLLHSGALLLLVGIAVTAWRVYRLGIRLAYFVDTASLKHFGIVRFLKKTYRSFRGEASYEYNPVDFSDADIAEIVGVLKPDGNPVTTQELAHSIQIGDEKDVRSIGLRFDYHGKANEKLAELVLICLQKGYLIQYLTASRHPIEFMEYLKKRADEKKSGQWAALANQIIVIDAYTPHFGFTDSVYQVATNKTKALGAGYVASTQTYAGLHTAASVAFNKNKKKQKGGVRRPALIIYEDCYALSDLESIEQYRIFMRHVIPSERLWDGMFTVFIETVQAENDWALLKSYVDAIFDFRHIPAKKE